MNDEQEVTVGIRNLADLPVSAPVWLLAVWVMAVFALAIWAAWGGLNGFAAVIATASFSFQFWCYVIHRGLRRRGSGEGL